MLELYYSATCPYCRKVIDYFENNNIEYVPKNISEPENYDNLLNLGNLSQVPFLVDTDKNISMYESDEIINYVKNSR